MRFLSNYKTYDLELEIYLPLVDSLFKERRAFIIGAIIMDIAIFATFLKTGALPLLGFAVAFAVVAAARLAFMHGYGKCRDGIRNAADAKRWEFGYVLGAATSVGLLALWAFASFAVTDDAYAHLVSFTMTIGYVIGIFGRNFGSPKFVLVQILCAWLPLTVALVVFGDLFHWIFAALLVPFFLAVKLISDRLRNMLLDAIVATRQVTQLAARFDTALTNMPHGLCMLDPAGRIVVSNERCAQLFGVDHPECLKGWDIARLIRHFSRSGLIPAGDARRISRHLRQENLADAGEIVVDAAGGRSWAVNVQPMASGGMVALVQDITERRQAEQLISQMANFDSLTELPNRNQFYQTFAALIAQVGDGPACALHFIDLDHFKHVNDTLGHAFGDKLLRDVGESLRSLIRRSDTAARLGGDEFVVLQSGDSGKDGAAALARRLIRELGRPYDIDGHEIIIGASVGIALMPDDGLELDVVLRRADMALYAAKSEGRGAVRFFSEELDVQVQERRRAETNLRKAISNDEFEVYFQPIIELSSGGICVCEALLRWRHKERGIVSAGEFIAVAEETGAIAELGRIVLEKACRACAGWPKDVGVSVNISPLQLARTDIVADVEAALQAAGLAPERLELEITETSLLQTTNDVQSALLRLKELGIRLSLDDFGTGYSSLSYLHSVPLDKIKIDRSFMRNIVGDARSQTLLYGITRLSAELGHRVTVEGIETREQLGLVTAEGSIHEVQGFLFSPAVPPALIHEILWGQPKQWVAERERAAASTWRAAG